MALVDEPQNDGSAKSATQIESLNNLIRKTLACISGYEKDKKTGKMLIKPLTILMTVTCIQPNDFAVQFTDRVQNPDFNGIIFRRFPQMPTPIPRLWHQYKEILVKEGGSKSKPCLERNATQFYLAHRKEMDKGFIVDDENDYEPFQVSAIQYGMDMWCENEKGFWCEHQNDPEAAQAAESVGLSPRYILREKVRRFTDDPKRLAFRRWIPENTEFLAGFIDVGLHYLNYEVTAFGKGFSFAHVVDFGYFPDQKGYHRIRKHDVHVDMQKSYRDGSPEEKISWGVRDCLTEMFSREYFDHNGEPLDIHRPLDYTIGRDAQKARFLAIVGVDANDFDQEEAVWSGIAQFNAQSRNDFPVLNRALPCYGEPTKPKHMRYWKLDVGEWQRGRDRFHGGEGEWIEFPYHKLPLMEKYAGQVHSCLKWEANAYRTLRNTAWITEPGANGCQTLFDDLHEIIVPYAEQQCAMVPDSRSRIGTDYDNWVLPKPRRADKEFFDTNSGSWMIASYVGLNPEFGITVTVPEVDYQKGVNWIEKIKSKYQSEVSPVRGRTRR
jgi:hypothetical protein